MNLKEYFKQGNLYEIKKNINFYDIDTFKNVFKKFILIVCKFQHYHIIDFFYDTYYLYRNNYYYPYYNYSVVLRDIKHKIKQAILYHIKYDRYCAASKLCTYIDYPGIFSPILILLCKKNNKFAFDLFTSLFNIEYHLKIVKKIYQIAFINNNYEILEFLQKNTASISISKGINRILKKKTVCF